MYEKYLLQLEEAGKIRNLKERSINCYKNYVSYFLNYMGKSPEELTCQDVRDFLLAKKDNGLKAATLNLYNSAIRFFYRNVLHILWDDITVPRMLTEHKLPVVLSADEIDRLLNATDDLKYKTMFATMYSSGMRVSEIIHLHYGDISRTNMQIHIRDAKNRMDRYTILLGGGLTSDNRWKDKGETFFLPIRVISKVFRGKYMEELKKLWEEDKLVFHGTALKYRNHYAFRELLDSCYDKDWIPHCKKTFNGAQSVINYLGKYTHRIAVSNHRIIRMDDDTVTFSVKDYRNEGQWKELTISGAEFVRRFLMHVPPKRFVRIRHYGLLCSRTKNQKLALCRNLLGCKKYISKLRDMEMPQILEHLYGIKICVCKACGGHLGKPQMRMPLRC